MLETEKKTVATNFTGVRKLCIPKAEQRFVLGNSAKYRAELIYKGSTFRIGYFPTLETAVTAYNTEASKLGGLVRHYYDSSLSNPFSTPPAFIRPKRILMGWWFGVPSLHNRVWALPYGRGNAINIRVLSFESVASSMLIYIPFMLTTGLLCMPICYAILCPDVTHSL